MRVREVKFIYLSSREEKYGDICERLFMDEKNFFPFSGNPFFVRRFVRFEASFVKRLTKRLNAIKKMLNETFH